MIFFCTVEEEILCAKSAYKKLKKWISIYYNITEIVFGTSACSSPSVANHFTTYNDTLQMYTGSILKSQSQIEERNLLFTIVAKDRRSIKYYL
jgi:hypothetical protein